MLRKVQHSQVLHIKAKHSSMSQRTVQDLYEQSMQKTHSHILTYALITYTTHILTYALITYTSHIVNSHSFKHSETHIPHNHRQMETKSTVHNIKI